MSEETKAAFESMRFYKFYPVQTPDTPDISNVKVEFWMMLLRISISASHCESNSEYEYEWGMGLGLAVLKEPFHSIMIIDFWLRTN